jgi:hypothetical protein
MKRTFGALLSCAALVTASVATPPPTAQADEIADWNMQLVVMDTSWSDLITTNFLTCKDLALYVQVSVQPGVQWSVSGEIRGVGSTTVLGSFAANGIGPTTYPQPPWIPGVSMCQHFGGPIAPPDHEYVATATALVPTSTTPEQGLTDRFTIRPISSYVAGAMHELRDGVSMLLGSVWVQADGFRRPAPPGLVTVERLEGPTWLKTGEAVSAADGSVAVKADRLLAAGTYIRFLYPGDYWVAPYVGSPWQLTAAWSPPTPIVYTPPPPPAPLVFTPPTARVKVKAVSGRSKLKVDVNPNMGGKYWTFQVQMRMADGTWKPLKTYKTLGSTEKRTVNLPKGTYQVWVNPKFNHQGVMSTPITLKR